MATPPTGRPVGRPKGSKNAKTREIADRAAAEGITPLEYMLSVMRDPGADVARRDDMAKAAASFMHPRLSSIEAKLDHAGVDPARATLESLESDLRDAYLDLGLSPAKAAALAAAACSGAEGQGAGEAGGKPH